MVIRCVKVSEKGQIAIPLDIRTAAGIYQGEELIMIEEKGKILIEKSKNVSKKLRDDFKDILKYSSKSLKEVWDNSEDDIWSSYLQK
tara:strand:- start:813 stop:1073 length:261 start_codon:yes stop_codon:yes gene_type:complete